MMCQACNTRAATVHYAEMVDDKLDREIHLCEECYAAQKPAASPEVPAFLGSVVGASLGPAVSVTAGAGTTAEPAAACPQCGLSYAAFRTRGRLGCPQCYEAFRAQLEPLLERIHTGLQHTGKSPFDAGGAPGADAAATKARAKEKAILGLRRKLQEAIRAEDYERAASLRDQLRRAEIGEDVE